MSATLVLSAPIHVLYLASLTFESMITKPSLSLYPVIVSIIYPPLLPLYHPCKIAPPLMNSLSALHLPPFPTLKKPRP